MVSSCVAPVWADAFALDLDASVSAQRLQVHPVRTSAGMVSVPFQALLEFAGSAFPLFVVKLI